MTDCRIFRLPPTETKLLLVPNLPYQIYFNSHYGLFTCGQCGIQLAANVPFLNNHYMLMWNHFTRSDSPHPKPDGLITKSAFISVLKSFHSKNFDPDSSIRLQGLIDITLARGVLSSPVEGLSYVTNAFMCKHAGCYQTNIDLNSIIRHIRRSHQSTVSNKVPSSDISTQQFAQSWTRRTYLPALTNSLPEFHSSSNPSVLSPNNLLSLLDSSHNDVEKYRADISEPTDISSHEYFAKWDRITSSLSSETVVHLIELTDMSLHQNLFPTTILSNLIESWFSWACSISFDSDTSSYFLSRIVMNLSRRKNEEEKLFTNLQKKTTGIRYAAYTSQLVKFILLLCGFFHEHVDGSEIMDTIPNDWKLHEDSPLYPYAENAWAVITSIVGTSNQPSSSDLLIVNDFIRTLLCRALPFNSIQSKESVIQFLVLSNTHKHDGTRRKGNTITQTIAQLQYTMRLSFITHYLTKLSNQTSITTYNTSFEEDFRQSAEEFVAVDDKYNISNLLSCEMAYITTNTQNRPEPKVNFECPISCDHLTITPLGNTPSFTLCLEEMRESIAQCIISLNGCFTELFDGFNVQNHLPTIISLYDDGQNTANNYSFLTDPRNTSIRKCTEQFINHMMEKSSCVFSFLPSAKKFLSSSRTILEHIWFLLFITTGLPYRSTTWRSTRLRNSPHALRNIRLCLSDNNLTFFHYYDKSRNRKQSEQLRAKFCPISLEAMVLQYLILVRPLENIISRLFFPDDIKSIASFEDFLFVSHGGRWTENKMLDLVQYYFRRFINKPLNVSLYRHVSQAWARHHLPNDYKSHVDSIVDIQFGHSAATGDIYGTESGAHKDIFDTYLCRHREICRHWQELLHLISKCTSKPRTPILVSTVQTSKVLTQDSIETSASTISNQSPAGQSTQHELKIYHLTTSKQERFNDNLAALDHNHINVDHKLLQRVLQHYHGQRRNLFQSSKVRDHFRTILSHPTHDFISVLPTGVGKSSIFQYMSLLESNKITVVIVPLKATLLDQMSFCLRNQLPFTEYSQSINQFGTIAPLLFVQLEHVNFDFNNMLSRFEQAGRLGRIFVDESHLALLHHSFRVNISFLSLLTSLKSQKVYLTATLPLHLVDDFCQIYACTSDIVKLGLGVGECLLPRNLELIRSQFSTKVVQVEYLQSQAASTLSSSMSGGSDRVIYFCPTKKEVLYLSNMIKSSQVYHGDLTTQQRESSMRLWKESSDTPCMIATSAFAMGVDYGFVTYIAIIDTCYSLLDLVQMAGRGGRSPGTVCVVDFLVCPHQHETNMNFSPDHNVSYYRENKTHCRRMILNYYMSSSVSTCGFSDSQCDICRMSHSTPSTCQKEAGIIWNKSHKPLQTNPHGSYISPVTPCNNILNSSIGNQSHTPLQTNPHQSYVNQVIPNHIPNNNFKEPPDHSSMDELIHQGNSTTHVTPVKQIAFSRHAKECDRTVTQRPNNNPILTTTHMKQSSTTVVNPYTKRSMQIITKQNPIKKLRPLCPMAQIFRHKVIDYVDICGICYSSGHMNQHHSISKCPTVRNACFGCYQFHHSSVKCPYKQVKFKNVTGTCIKCMLSIDGHGDEPYGKECKLSPNDFVRSFSISLYHVNKRILSQILRDMNISGFSKLDFEAYMSWLVTREPQHSELNVISLIVHFLSNPQQYHLRPFL